MADTMQVRDRSKMFVDRKTTHASQGVDQNFNLECIEYDNVELSVLRQDRTSNEMLVINQASCFHSEFGPGAFCYGFKLTQDRRHESPCQETYDR